MTKIKGIYAAGMSILDENLSLNINKTILHAEKLIHQGCHGVAIFGCTGQAQLISVSEKINLLNQLSKNKFKAKNYVKNYSKSPEKQGFNSLTNLLVEPEVLDKKIFNLLDKRQLVQSVKKNICDHVINNNYSLTILKKNVKNFIKK